MKTKKELLKEFEELEMTSKEILTLEEILLILIITVIILGIVCLIVIVCLANMIDDIEKETERNSTIDLFCGWQLPLQQEINCQRVGGKYVNKSGLTPAKCIVNNKVYTATVPEECGKKNEN